MQINIDRKTGVLLGVIVLLSAAVLSLSINRDNNNPMNNSSGHMGHGSSSSTNSNYTGADIMFLQMMIPHHQQAIDISNLAMKSSQDAELLALAKIIARDQAAEIKQMKAWLKDAGHQKIWDIPWMEWVECSALMNYLPYKLHLEKSSTSCGLPG